MNAAFSLLASGRSHQSRRAIRLFLAAALGSATWTYGTLSIVGASLVQPSRRSQETLIVVILVVAALWHGTRQGVFPGPRFQMRRDFAEHPTFGAAIYGAVLGVGLLTIMTTPLVWSGVVVSLLGGRWWVGCLYGAGFAVGRTLPLLVQYRLDRTANDAASRSAVVHWTRDLQPRVMQLTSVCVAALALAFVVR